VCDVQLADVLAKSAHVTSLDLTSNFVSDDAAQLLAEALNSGGAPDLIQLDLRGNPLTDAGIATVVRC
jgi:Ran GTPase-activating protein (RanGAP) involved in mRNA processing and transport